MEMIGSVILKVESLNGLTGTSELVWREPMKFHVVEVMSSSLEKNTIMAPQAQIEMSFPPPFTKTKHLLQFYDTWIYLINR